MSLYPNLHPPTPCPQGEALLIKGRDAPMGAYPFPFPSCLEDHMLLGCIWGFIIRFWGRVWSRVSLLMASYLSGATLEEASWIGNCGAGVVVGKNGTATVALDELSQFHNHLANTLQ